jgi:plasmid stability protein
MVEEVIQVHLPEELYHQIEQRAHRMRCSIEDEMVAILAAALPTMEELPADIIVDLEHLGLLNDDELWQTARTSLPLADADRMQMLLLKRKRQTLTPEEQREAEHLLDQYDRCMLVRSKAAQLLKERGQDISSLKKQLSR